jgi:hypothetical protein
MPEHLRALVVILLIAGLVFGLGKKLALGVTEEATYKYRRNLWIALTVIGFLANNFWIYVLVASTVLAIAIKRENNRLALFFLLLFVMPPARSEIPGFGLINYLFAMNHLRMLSLIILLPSFLAVRNSPDTTPFGRTIPDRILALFLIVTLILQFRDTTATDAIRQGFYLFLDIFLPYYVASRTLRNLNDFRDALLGFVLAALLLAAIGSFESIRHWLLYSAVVGAWDLSIGFSGGYLGRAGLIRASASTGHAIALGYMMAVAIGFYLFVSNKIQNSLYRRFGYMLLVAGLVAPLSRGPWVGCVALVFTYISTGKFALRRLITVILIGLLSLPLLSVVPGGQTVINLIPYVGQTEKENISYRENLLDNSIVVIQRNLWFGSANYLEAPEMQAMIQGQGIIDIVNSYIAVALETGIIGLGLFIGFFIAVLLKIRSSTHALVRMVEEEHLLGRALFATLIGILVIIATVSSILAIPVVYWSVAGLGVGYAQMIERRRQELRLNTAAER